MLMSQYSTVWAAALASALILLATSQDLPHEDGGASLVHQNLEDTQNDVKSISDRIFELNRQHVAELEVIAQYMQHSNRDELLSKSLDKIATAIDVLASQINTNSLDSCEVREHISTIVESTTTPVTENLVETTIVELTQTPVAENLVETTIVESTPTPVAENLVETITPCEPCPTPEPCPAPEPCPSALPCPEPEPCTTPEPMTPPPPCPEPQPQEPCPLPVECPTIPPPPVANIIPIKMNCKAPFFSLINKCIYLSTTARTWQTARRKCQSLGADLITLEAPNALPLLVDYLKSKALLPGRSYWVGGSKKRSDSKHQWVSGKAIRYGWQRGQPNDEGEACVVIGVPGSLLFDVNCARKEAYICGRW